MIGFTQSSYPALFFVSPPMRITKLFCFLIRLQSYDLFLTLPKDMQKKLFFMSQRHTPIPSKRP